MMNIRSVQYLIFIILMNLVFTVTAGNETSATDNETIQSEEITKVWDFNATLDGDPIGNHRFEVVEDESGTTVKTEATLDVKFLFITVYSYKHNNEEKWIDDCLVSLNSDTDDNGDMSTVTLLRKGDESLITTKNLSITENSCVRSFSYWDPELLKIGSLLNSQTGEILNIDFQYIGTELLDIHDRQIESRRYQLLGKDKAGVDIEIDLWYTDNNRWIGLQSKLENGSYLRYQLDSSVL